MSRTTAQPKPVPGAVNLWLIWLRVFAGHRYRPTARIQPCRVGLGIVPQRIADEDRQ
jgi:hypothetical protein